MTRHVVIGAGPAGLTAAWQLVRQDEAVLVLEADPAYVGGLARTMEFDGYRYDVGPHRYYTKSEQVQRMWREMLPDEFLQVSRLTRIYYERKFYPYPLAVRETLRNIGWGRALRCGLSWVRAQVLPRRPERSFEDWIVNRFGYALYAAFFRTYTEKVWGVPCSQINKDWAAQRIRGLSLGSVLRNALQPVRARGRVKSLVDRFDYPRRGAGQLWEAVRDEVVARGGEVRMGQATVRVHHEGGRVQWVETADGERHHGEHFYVTMTLRSLVEALDPAPPEAVLAAGRGLEHRDFMTVALPVARGALFPDQWIYVHDPGVRVARITNYANWSDEMSPDATTTVLGMEYFCTRGDDLWRRSDQDVLALAHAELARIGLGPGAGAREVGAPRGRVHRILDAYPVYDDHYRRHRDTLRDWLSASLPNLHPAGRKGLHNYNSQDHAMMTATLAVRGAVEGLADADPWAVNTEQEYAEEGDARRDIEERLVPRPLAGPHGPAGGAPPSATHPSAGEGAAKGKGAARGGAVDGSRGGAGPAAGGLARPDPDSSGAEQAPGASRGSPRPAGDDS